MTVSINRSKRAIIGVGYLGLPLAVKFGKQRPVLGFDINAERVAELQAGQEHTLGVGSEELKRAIHLRFSADPSELKACTILNVTVSTQIDEQMQPDLTLLIKASEIIREAMKKKATSCGSTVNSGATEEDCVPVLEKHTGLEFNVDSFAGYSRDFNSAACITRCKLICRQPPLKTRRRRMRITTWGRSTAPYSTAFTETCKPYSQPVALKLKPQHPSTHDFRADDVRHSQADVSKANQIPPQSSAFD